MLNSLTDIADRLHNLRTRHKQLAELYAHICALRAATMERHKVASMFASYYCTCTQPLPQEFHDGLCDLLVAEVKRLEKCASLEARLLAAS